MFPFLLLLQLRFLVPMFNRLASKTSRGPSGRFWRCLVFIVYGFFWILMDYFLSSTRTVHKCHSYHCFPRRCKLRNLFRDYRILHNCEWYPFLKERHDCFKSFKLPVNNNLQVSVVTVSIFQNSFRRPVCLMQLQTEDMSTCSLPVI